MAAVPEPATTPVVGAKAEPMTSSTPMEVDAAVSSVTAVEALSHSSPDAQTNVAAPSSAGETTSAAPPSKSEPITAPPPLEVRAVDKQAEDVVKATPAVALKKIQPCLRGLLTADEAGRVRWVGKWGMSEAAFESTTGYLSPFEYTRTRLVEAESSDASLAANGYFSGHFMLGSTSGAPPTRHDELDIRFEFVPADSTSSVFSVRGEGSNQFGVFALSGTFSPASGELHVTREYTKANAKRRRSSVNPKPTANKTPGTAKAKNLKRPRSSTDGSAAAGGTAASARRPPPSLMRQSSGRMRKIPAHLKDVEEDPKPVRLNELWRKMQKVVHDVMAADEWAIFKAPVDAEALNLKDYHAIVTHPMDLGTVMRKMNQGVYKEFGDVAKDVKLTFDNAMLYNPRNTPVHTKASSLLQLFQSKYGAFVESVEESKAKAAAAAAKIEEEKRKSIAKKEAEKREAERKREEKRKSLAKAKEAKEAREAAAKETKAVKAPKAKPKSRKSSAKASRRARSDDESEDSDNDNEVLKQMKKQMEAMKKQMAMMSRMQQMQSEMSMAMPMMPQMMPAYEAAAESKPKPKRKKPEPKQMTFQEKRELGQDIHKLPPEKLQRVVTILQESGAPLGGEGEEIELDIDRVDMPTLRKLQKYVRTCLAAERRKSAKENPSTVLNSIEDAAVEAVEKSNSTAVNEPVMDDADDGFE